MLSLSFVDLLPQSMEVGCRARTVELPIGMCVTLCLLYFAQHAGESGPAEW